MYIELQISSNFSFLEGASHPQELAAAAESNGYAAVALTDRNTLSGIVLAHSYLKRISEPKTRFIVGCRLDLINGFSLLCYPANRAAYGRLTRLLSLGKRRAQKGDCILSLSDIEDHCEDIHFIFPFPQVLTNVTKQQIITCGTLFQGKFHLALTHSYRGDDKRWIQAVVEFTHPLGIPTVATNDVLYHVPKRKALQDILVCIREKCTIEQAGFRLSSNAERYLKSPQEMVRLFAPWPESLEATLEIANSCRFSLDELRYEYPDEVVEPGLTPFDDLVRRTWAGAQWRFPLGISAEVRQQIEHEFELVAKLDYAPYFLTVHDIVKFAKQQSILCQGRGSAANSMICYCLGITEVDPVEKKLLFERFISAARNEPPDIDVDFEHERREEVIQYIYEKYGRHRTGIASTVVHYRTRRAVREVGKALGLSSDVVGSLTKLVWGWSNDGINTDSVREAGLDPGDKRLRLALTLSQQLIGFPRHLSQHVGGFVIARSRLDELVPVENATMPGRTIVQWDKDDLEQLGMMKVDVLSLGILTAIRKAFTLLDQYYGQKLTLATIPQEDPAVYQMLQKADSIGVFQVESRAQQSMLPRLKPQKFYDLVIEVAIVRPGPIQGDMVHPYLRRREGKELIEFPSKELENILGKTLGVPLFQEQAMQIAIVGAGFSPEQADQLRRSLATFRHVGTISTFRDRFIQGMLARNYSQRFAERCFSQIEGFGTYGFPESHSISFANLVYASAWIKCHHPDVFCVALLNSQPMGFYAPAQLIRDARNHTIEVRPIDVNRSYWETSLELIDGTDRYAIRLGFQMVAGLSQKDGMAITDARGAGYSSVGEIAKRTHCKSSSLKCLAQADAFHSLGLSRRQALWQVGLLHREEPPLFSHVSESLFDEPEVSLPPLTTSQEVVEDYRATGLTLRQHPVSFLRARLQARRVIPIDKLKQTPNNKLVTVAGLVLFRQRPGTAKGTIFLTIEDETGAANLIIWKALQQKSKKAIYAGKLLVCQGVVQSEGSVIHVIVRRIWDWSDQLRSLQLEKNAPSLPIQSRDFH